VEAHGRAFLVSRQRARVLPACTKRQLDKKCGRGSGAAERYQIPNRTIQLRATSLKTRTRGLRCLFGRYSNVGPENPGWLQAVRKRKPNNIVEFPVLTEAALKQPHPFIPAVELRLTADTSLEVLTYASDAILNYIDTAMKQGVFVSTFEVVATEITISTDRLIEIARMMPDAPEDPEAGQRLRVWFDNRYCL
jgi:hypothetical protein